MRSSKTTISEKNKNSVLLKSNRENFTFPFNKLFIKPFLTGTLTFLIFLMITLFIDFIVNIFSGNYKFQIGIFTLLISFAGFILGFIYRVLEIKKNKS
jgi:hypothetical protein